MFHGRKPDCEGNVIRTDVLVHSPSYLPGPVHTLTDAETARCTAVLVLNNENTTEGEVYLCAGASGVVDQRESGDRFVDAVKAVTMGASVARADASVSAERPDLSDRYLSERDDQAPRQISRGRTYGQLATRTRADLLRRRGGETAADREPSGSPSVEPAA
jgi:hypothetical protein